MPMNRSRARTRPATTMESVEKYAEPSRMIRTAASSRSGLAVSPAPMSAPTTKTTAVWERARRPAENALPATTATAGVGVTISFASRPASRSQTSWTP
jgi:hypothetical protein